MAQQKTPFIKVEGIPEGSQQTLPVEPSERIPDSDIRIEACTENDADKIAEGLINIFPEDWWTKREPPSTRPAPAIRQARMTARIKPTLLIPTIRWIKAVHILTNQTIGIAGWTHPDHPAIFNHFGRDAFPYYDLQSKMGWSDAYVEEIWSSIDPEAWDAELRANDVLRKEILGDEKHWYLAPLMVWHEWQGKGVGRVLLDWAIEQADRTVPPTPVYLESAQTARAVYLHCGFVPCGKTNMVRRGSGVS